MELMKKLFHGKGYIDGITIINLGGGDPVHSQTEQQALQPGGTI